jgi:hypothetical protein
VKKFEIDGLWDTIVIAEPNGVLLGKMPTHLRTLLIFFNYKIVNRWFICMSASFIYRSNAR